MVKKIKSKIAIILATLAVFCFGLGVCVFQTDLVKAQTSVSVLDGFTMNEKASVRRADPVGIRFTVNLDEETRTLYENLCSSSTVEIGSILLPEDMLNGGELTLDTDNVLRIPTEVWKEEDHSVFQSVLGGQGGANLPESYYNRPITARGYIEATDDSGNVTIYYTKNACTRSIGYVAVKAREAGDDTELLEKIAEKTIIDISLADQNLSLVAGKGSILSNALNGEFDSTATKLVIGGIYQDIAENVSYEIANTSVASVDAEGKITAKTTGTTTVTATYTYGGVEYSASSNLTVSNDFVGESDYSILITESAKTGNTNEYLAALKIQEVVKKASGVELPIVTETLNEVTTGKYVSVGKTNLVNSTNGAVSVSGDLDTQSIVTAVDNTLFILGNTEFGTLLGVQQWLGDVLGYDFFLKDTYSVTAETIDLPTETIEYIPQIEYNSIDRNGNVAHEWGIQNYASGVIQVGGNIHNSTLVLSPDTYYSNYADWYATKTTTVLWWENTELITDSSGKAAELCYTAHGNTTAYNAMVATTASKIVEAFNANPTLHRVAFSVRDGYYECNCDTCTSKGNTSDTFVIFLNDVCAKVEESLSGDARQSKFKIVTLAYHQTNEAPNNISSLANYASFKNHVELWFGDSYGDYTDGLKDSSSAKNQEIYNNFVAWKNLVGDNDTLLWVYYTNTKNGFVPYNTFTAIRENYALAYDTGVDNVFNQTIQGVTGWTMLKHYLISKLAWNAKPTDSEWNAWIDEYFENAYGNGATAMREWFNDWLDDDLSAYATEDSDPAIHRDMVSESNFPKATMEKWVGYANTAIAALDENDPNYTRHYNNIVLEKLSPEYFLIELYGMTADYAQEFVWGAELWGITHLGENVKIDATLAEIESNIESATIEDKFFAELQSDGTYLVTLENGNIKAGTTYTLTGTTASSITASVDGELNVSLTSSASVGEANSVMVSSSDYTVTFTNVIAVTKILRTAEDINVLNGAKAGAGNYITGYYLLGNDIDCADALYEAGSYSTGFFRAVFDGNGYTISNIKVGSCGIFGALYGATIKDVNFENVSIVSTANNFNALLAGSVTNNTTIENVNVTYKAIQWPYADSYAKNKMTGLLVTRWNNTAHTVSNVTLNAGALTVTNALGYELSTVTFENVKVLANEVTLIGCTTAYDNETNLTSWPTGVTYIDTLEEITDNNKYIAEAGAISLENANFEVGEIYDVTCGSATAQTVIAEAGKLTATISDMAVGTTVTVTCVTEGKSITFTNVFNVTKILRTADDLNVLNAANASGHITGYYVLGNNINCNGATFRSDARDGNKTFAGTFDGQGYTISNLKAGANGIFNLIVGGTVKNVNFTDVSLIKDNYHFTALLAGQTWGNTTIENVNVTYSAIEWPINNVLTSWAATGLLIARWSNATTVKVTNVTLDATGLNVTNALGTEITGVVFTNVTVKGDSYELIACTSADSSSGISEWPSGVTFTDTYVGVNVTLPSESDYYTFSGNSEAQVGSTYTFTVTEKVAGLNEFIVLVNGEEVTGNNGTYTVDVTGDLTIQVLHRYVESGSVASVTYNGDEIIVTNATSTSDANYMAYISSDYVNYLISLGYTKLQVYIAPDLTIANQAGVKCGENARTRTASNYTAVAEFDLTADNPIIFWCQKDGSGNAIQGQGGYMKITGLVYVKADGTTLSGMPTTVEVTTPSESDYYTFTGSSSAILNGNYTFTITEKVAGLNDFIVLINGNVVEGVNGVYTEENVTEALTIQVLHGYIEHGANVTVGYNGNKITLTNAVQGTYSEGNAPYMAYITADYINYMLAQGYNYISFDYSADNTIAYQACAGWKASDNKLFAYVIDGTTQTIVVDLSNLRDNILYFWGQNAGGSGGQIANQGAQVYVENLKFYKGKVSVTAPVDSDYYTFSGDANAYIGETYTFTVTEKVAGLNDFIVLINGNVVEGVNGVYTEENVSEALTIQVVHGYVEYGSVSSAEYIGNKLIITNSTSAGDANYMAYISADYVNYMMSKGYTNVHIYLQPDGEKADQAIVACGNTIVRTPSNYTSVADVTLVADTMIKFWCQKNGSGSSIQGQGGYMTITGIAYGGTESGMPTTVEVTMPSESDYYTFTGSSSAILNGNYTFTVTEKVSGLNNFIVLVNGVEVTGNSGTYTVENVTEALTIKVIHGYIEYGTTSTVTYDENGVATVTNSTSTNNEAFMAYISADYVNYLLSKGYNYIDFYITPDGTTADTALVMCGNTIGRTVENGGTSIARVQLKADTAIVFWCQKGSSGSTIQGQGGYMTVQFIAFRETA